ncbi:MAG: glycosyltransferase [Dehalococcoidia bacterium]|nr:MAG: glycosyltransferase [Dehalococcoidia bacterium]
MHGTLALSHRALSDLKDVAGEEELESLRALARPIEGLRVLNLSVTRFGTGTADLLDSAVPLLSDLGVDVHWQIVRTSEDDAAVQRAMYQALGGVFVSWTREMTDTWLSHAEMNAQMLTDPYDVVIVHDPQPLAIRSYVPEDTAKWVMDCHLDLTSAQTDVWMLLRPHVEKYDKAIFPAANFVRGDMPIETRIVGPAIDPNNARNMQLPDSVIRDVLGQYGIDADRPMICQISPCDAASDLCGAVDAWDIVRKRYPDLQLAIVLTTEPHDPEERNCYERLAERCRDEPSVKIVPVGTVLGNVEFNVFQRAASVVIQRGLRKGFGLWVSDALWKERPCVVAPAGGLTEQVLDGETGLVARTTEEFAAAIERLLTDQALAKKLGENGRRHVANHFLITRYLRDYLQILNELHRTEP